MKDIDIKSVDDDKLLIHWIFCGMLDVFDPEGIKKKDAYMALLKAEVDRRGLLKQMADPVEATEVKSA